jgi:hypothetical protein
LSIKLKLSLGAAALGVSNFSIAGVYFDTDEEAEENKQSSSCILIANKLIMKILRKKVTLMERIKLI